LTFVRDEKNLKVIQSLLKYGVDPSYDKSKNKLEKLKNKTFVLTGTLENYTRDNAKSLIENAGGKATNTVSKKTNFLISGSNSGSKLEKAKKLNIKILNETEFIKLFSE